MLSCGIEQNYNSTDGRGLVTSGNITALLGLGPPGSDFALDIAISYDGFTLAYSVTNRANQLSYSNASLIDVSAAIGSDIAWIGFTAATGSSSTQYASVSDWLWTSYSLTSDLFTSTGYVLVKPSPFSESYLVCRTVFGRVSHPIWLTIVSPLLSIFLLNAAHHSKESFIQSGKSIVSAIDVHVLWALLPNTKE